MTGAEIVVDGGWLLESGEYIDERLLITSLLKVLDHSQSMHHCGSVDEVKSNVKSPLSSILLSVKALQSTHRNLSISKVMAMSSGGGISICGTNG